jgi:hypothetical protein
MSTAPLYKIRDWEKSFDHRDTARTEGPLKWVKVPTKTDTYGFRRIAMEKDATDILAAWYLILGIAAKQERNERGLLSRGGEPLTPEDLAMMTGFNSRIFARTLAFLSQGKDPWLVAQVCEKSQEFAKNATRLDYSRVDENRLEEMTAGDSAEVSAPQPVQSVSDAGQSDAEWLESLKSNPAYRGIDVAREHAKALVWAAENKKQMSRRRFVNWLNRAERPMAQQSAIPGHSRASLPEPDDWRAWIHENAPESVYARGGTHEGAQWSTLDAITQEWITKQINQRRK